MLLTLFCTQIPQYIFYIGPDYLLLFSFQLELLWKGHTSGR
jgi:hypothetical protein